MVRAGARGCEPGGQHPEEEEAAIARLMALVDAYHHDDHPYTRLSALLDTFYEGRADSTEDWRIMVHCIHPGYYRLCSVCGYEAHTWSQPTRTHELSRAQAEMQSFTVFLKQLWQSSHNTSL